VVVAGVVLVAALAGLGPVVEPHFPFVNRNHLGGFVDLTALVALGLALHARGPERLLWLTGFALTAAVGLLSLSRSGFGGLIIGIAIFVFLYLRRRHAEARSGRWVLAATLAAAVAVVAGTAAYLASDELLGRLRSLQTVADESKPQLWLTGLHVARDAPWTGIGRGAFALVFAAYKTDVARFTYTHVENEWLQMVIDLGVPLGLVVVGTLAWTWLAAARRPAPTAIHVGLLAGTAAVALHDLADFSLDVVGVAIPFAVAMGLLAAPSRALWVRPQLLRGAIALGALLVLSGLTAGYVFDVQRMASSIAAVDAIAVPATAREVARWHPADYLPHAIAGGRLVKANRCGEGMPWLVRAMLMSPTEPLPHRFAGRCFALAGRSFLARREYRLALAYGDPDALAEAVAIFPTLEALYDVVPDTPGDLNALGEILSGPRPADAAQAYERSLAEEPDHRVLAALARVRLRLEQPAPALELAQRLIADRPDEAQGYALAHEALVALERPRDADAIVARGLEVDPGSFDLLGIQYSAAMSRRHFGQAKQIAEQIAPRTSRELSMKDLLAAGAMAAQGRYPEAIDRARMASDEDPSSVGALYQLAELQAAAGRYQDAIDVLERAADLPGSDREHCRKRIAELQAAAAGQAASRLLDPGSPPATGKGMPR
jgi:tetratricopeptide (TPR) repeat protein